MAQESRQRKSIGVTRVNVASSIAVMMPQVNYRFSLAGNSDLNSLAQSPPPFMRFDSHMHPMHPSSSTVRFGEMV